MTEAILAVEVNSPDGDSVAVPRSVAPLKNCTVPLGALPFGLPGSENPAGVTEGSLMLTVADRRSGWALPITAAVVVVSALSIHWVNIDCAGPYLVSPE